MDVFDAAGDWEMGELDVSQDAEVEGDCARGLWKLGGVGRGVGMVWEGEEVFYYIAVVRYGDELCRLLLLRTSCCLSGYHDFLDWG